VTTELTIEPAEATSVDAPVLAYPPEAVLEIGHVAAWLRVSERTVERLDIPFTLLGKRTKRYLARHVLEYLDRRRIS
jgi:hypothetical protein